MKIIPFYTNEKRMLRQAVTQNREAQRMLYDKYAPKMLSVCRQYIRDLHFAEDVMVSGFVKAFTKLDTFENRGSFEGWLRKIMVRQSISYLRKQQFVVFDDEQLASGQNQFTEATTSILDVEYLQDLIDKLPEGYKLVFVLYAVEGYKHHEIATMLDISVGTSKSQLFKARKLLQEKLRLQGIVPNGAQKKKG